MKKTLEHAKTAVLKLSIIAIASISIPPSRAENAIYHLKPSTPGAFDRMIIPADAIQKIYVEHKGIAASLKIQYIENNVVKDATIESQAFYTSAKLEQKAAAMIAKVSQLKKEYDSNAPVLFNDEAEGTEGVTAQIEPNWREAATQCAMPESRTPEVADAPLTPHVSPR